MTQVLTSESYHAPLARIAYRLIADGLPSPQVKAIMQGLMNSAAGPRDDRWHARFADVPRAIETAEAKITSKDRGRVEDLGPETTPPPREDPSDRLAPWEDETDAKMYHGPLGDLVRHLDPLTEADPRGVLASLMTMFGNWLGREFYLSVGADRHHGALYALLVGPSSTGRKGTAYGLARLCMDVLDPQWRKNNIFRSLNSGPGIVQTVKNLKERHPDDGRALFVIAEFADVLAKSTMPGNTIMTTLRDAWDDGSLENTSVTRPSRVRDATVSLIGMTTFEDLTEHLDLRELATGTMNRVLMVKVERSKMLPGVPPVLEGALVEPIVERLRDNVERLREHPSFVLKATSVPKPLRLSHEGEQRALMLKADCENQGKSWIDVGNSRAFAQMLRLALIYAVADGSHGIEVVHLNAAKDFVDIAMHGLRTVATGELKDVIAQRILKHMREDPKETLTRTGISRAVFNNHVPAEKLEQGLRTLIRLGLTTEHVEPTAGRPRTVYRLVA